MHDAFVEILVILAFFGAVFLLFGAIRFVQVFCGRGKR